MFILVKKMNMIRFCTILILTVAMSMGSFAQQHKGNQGSKFSKDEFAKQLEQFVAQEAQLTGKEAADFFPLFREMHIKMRKVFNAMRDIDRQNLNNDKSCAEAISQKDKMDIELKQIQQQYHNKFLKVLPACKVMKVIHAEDKFHRKMLKKWSNKGK